jgi:AAA+ ATPase superfamily predicted ATPase
MALPFHLVVTDVILVRIGNLRLASQNQPNPPNLNRMIEIGIRFEKEIFEKSPNKVRRGGMFYVETHR